MRRPGTTLLELLVAMGVSALLMSAVLAAFLSSSRLLSWVGTRSDVGSGALLGLNALAVDVRKSAYATLTIVNSPAPALSFRTEDANTTNLSVFTPAQFFTIYYFNAATQALVRKTWSGTLPGPLTPNPFTSTGSAGIGEPLTPAQLQSIIGQTNGTEHNVATSVVGVATVPATYPLSSQVNGIQVTLSLQKVANTGATCVQTVGTTVYPRNHP